MSIINTSERSGWFDRIPDLVSVLRNKVMEELDATNSYEQLARNVRMAGVPEKSPDGADVIVPPDKLSMSDAESIAKMIDHIRKEEIRHTAALLGLINELDPEVATAMQKGAGAL